MWVKDFYGFSRSGLFCLVHIREHGGKGLGARRRSRPIVAVQRAESPLSIDGRLRFGAAMSPSRRGLAGALTPGVHQRCGCALCAYVCRV